MDQKEDNLLRIPCKVSVANALLALDSSTLGAMDGVCIDPENPHITLKKLECDTILSRVAQTGPMKVDAVLQLLLKIAEGARYISTCRAFVFRSLNPENIYLGEDDTPLFYDFSKAVVLPYEVVPGEGAGLLSSPHVGFMAPELFSEKMADLTADIYSLALVGYFALTGNEPYRSISVADFVTKVATAAIPAINTNDAKTQKLVSLLSAMSVKNPSARVSSWNMVIAALHDIADGNEPKIKPIPRTEKLTIAPSSLAKSSVASAQQKRTTTTVKDGANNASPKVHKALEESPSRAKGFFFFLLYILILAFVANCKLGNPVKLPPAMAPDFHVAFLDKIAQSLAKGGAEQEEEPAVSASAVPVSSTEEVATSVSAPIVSAPEFPKAVSDSAPSATTSASSWYQDFKDALKSGDVEKAQKIAKDNGDGAVADLLADLPTLDDLFVGVCNEISGSEVSFIYMGKPRSAVVVSAKGDSINVRIGAGAKARSGSLSLAKIDEASKFDIIATKATNPQDAAACVVLALKSGKDEIASKVAKSAGALSKIFAE